MELELHWINPAGRGRRSVALGTFDGVHLGHQQLLQRAIATKPKNGFSSVFTFDYPPEQIFTSQPALISDFTTRTSLILANGIDEIVWVKFNKAFAAVRCEKFVEDILVRTLQAEYVICGFNFRFGYKAEGNPEILTKLGKKYGYQVEIIPPFNYQGQPVSSTRIRNLLQQGEVEKAAPMLGRFPSYGGVVVEGAKRGRQLGFPTANLSISPELQLPQDGVYFSWCYLSDGSSHPAVTAISNNPTFAGESRSVEAFLLDFQGELYGQSLRLEFLRRIRDIFVYSSGENLKQQIEDDVRTARKWARDYRLQEGRIVLQ